MNAGPKFRTPYQTTGADLAAALGMTTRAKQDVHVVSSLYSGSPFGARSIVRVDGEYYEVHDLTLNQLRRGITPAELELEPCDPDDDYSDFEG
jgi:hypothetical protein